AAFRERHREDEASTLASHSTAVFEQSDQRMVVRTPGHEGVPPTIGHGLEGGVDSPDPDSALLHGSTADPHTENDGAAEHDDCQREAQGQLPGGHESREDTLPAELSRGDTAGS